jgi:hypothetical protein
LKTLYRHVDILNRSGRSAFAVHARRGFRCRWFANETPVTSIAELELDPRDVLVVPEIFDHAFQPRSGKRRAERLRGLWRSPEMPWRACHSLIERASRIVILNLNPYNTFRLCTVEGTSPVIPYRHARVVAVLTISKDCECYLRHAFPDLPVVNYTKAVDSERFAPHLDKRPQLCFMPRKKRKDAIQVLNILRVRGALDDFAAVPIEGLTEDQVARVMSESRVFLSFSHDEGLPRPPMEAILSGCVVVGYHGQGGAEYMNPDFCFPIPEGDVVGYAQVVERVLSDVRRDPSAFDEQLKRARKYVLSHYAPNQEEREVSGFWNRLAAGEPLEAT